jgi:hypothetical protein
MIKKMILSNFWRKPMRLYFLIGLTLLLLLSGCYSKPVRHLASDASLIKAGESTRIDVLQYLGEPNGRRAVGPGIEESAP